MSALDKDMTGPKHVEIELAPKQFLLYIEYSHLQVKLSQAPLALAVYGLQHWLPTNC